MLCWAWSALIRAGTGWRASVRLAGSSLERRLAQAGAHLARTCAGPPPVFHARWRLVRWRVLLRRTVPLAALVLPPLLLAWFTASAESPRLEFPPAPRPPPPGAW